MVQFSGEQSVTPLQWGGGASDSFGDNLIKEATRLFCLCFLVQEQVNYSGVSEDDGRTDRQTSLWHLGPALLERTAP